MSSSSGEFKVDELSQMIRTKTDEINTAIDELANKDSMSPADMLDLQFQMNLFTQLNETTGAVAAGMHEVTRGFIRNINK